MIPIFRREYFDLQVLSTLTAPIILLPLPQPAKIAIGLGNLTTVTDNRRASISPYVKHDTIDPNLGVLRVDDATDNSTIATLWNFAIHGVMCVCMMYA